MKICNKCLIEKDEKEFFKDAASSDGRYSICKSCKTKSTLQWRSKNKDLYNKNMREYQASHKDNRRNCDYKRTYGITLEDFNRILTAQNGLCAICGKSNASSKRHFAIDHCHKTGKVRGILCYGCNRALHILDSEELLKKALTYLEKSK